MTKPVVCIIGAGTAGLEGLLSAREILGAGADLTLLAPDREFRYRPMSRDSLFHPMSERGVKIAELVAEVRATWVRDRAEVVHEAERFVLTRDGDTVEFDFLLLAPGERRARPLRHGYLWERGGDPSFLDQIIREIAAGEVESVAVAVPRGARWPVPAYELALVLAWTAAGTDASISLITAEERPLGALGAAASDAVAGELERAGVETITGVEIVDAPERAVPTTTVADLIIVPEAPAEEATALTGEPTDPARVRIGAGAPRQFDRLISLPVMLGPSIVGVPSDAAGFIVVDESLQVCGSERMWAAGGCIAAALEHSALSARQADAAIAAIAAAVGQEASVTGSATAPGGLEVAGVLLAGQRDRWLAANPIGISEPSTRCLWWPPGRAVGRMLARRIAAWDPSVDEQLPARVDGLAVSAPIALGCSAVVSTQTGAEVSDAVRRARLRDIEDRQLMAVQRIEHEAAAEEWALRAGLETLAAHQRRVIHSLQQSGYLRDR